MIKGIIVEGCDCSGKTTLIKTLKAKLSWFGWDLASLGHQDVNQFDRYMGQYIFADKIVFDRAHFSECVYSDVWRGGCSFQDWELQSLNKYVYEHFIVILTHVSPEVLKKRYQERSFEQIIAYDELELVQNKFHRLLDHPNVIKYNASTPEALDAVIDNILKRLEEAQLTKNIVK
ncbi:MAG: hypothetical protein ABH827_02210 [bacterium]